MTSPKKSLGQNFLLDNNIIRKIVGLVDVSSYSGNLYVAFKYVGSGNDNSLDGGYFVDDVLFLKQ